MGFLLAKPKVDAYNSPSGQFVAGLSSLTQHGPSEFAQEVQGYQWAYNLSMVAMLIGALLVVVGYVRDSKGT